MKKVKLIVESGFSLHQKIILFTFSIPPLLFIIGLLYMDFNWRGYLLLFFLLLLYSFIISLVFSKKGLIIKNGKLYKGKFCAGIPIFRRQVDFKKKPVVSILKFRKSQKFSFFSGAKPDLSESFNSFEVFLLNNSHFKKNAIMYCKKEENAKKVVGFLVENLPLRYEVYSPQYHRRNQVVSS